MNPGPSEIWNPHCHQLVHSVGYSILFLKTTLEVPNRNTTVFPKVAKRILNSIGLLHLNTNNSIDFTTPLYFKIMTLCVYALIIHFRQHFWKHYSFRMCTVPLHSLNKPFGTKTSDSLPVQLGTATSVQSVRVGGVGKEVVQRSTQMACDIITKNGDVWES